MEMQQLANINVSGSQKTVFQTDAKSAQTGTPDSRQESRFEDQLNQQVEQARKNSNQDKNQIDRSTKSNNEIADKNAMPAAEKGLDDSAETQLESVLTANEDGEVTAVMAELITSYEPAQTEIDTDKQLPLAGILLPHSELNAQGVEIVATAQLASSAQKGTAAMQSPKLTEVLTEQAKTVADPVITDQVVLPALGKSALNQTDKTSLPFYSSAQVSNVVNEMPAADIIAQTTRMQRVPLTTDISANMSVSHTNQIVATADLAGSLATNPTTSNNTLPNSLSSTITANLISPDWSKQMTQQVSFMLQGGVQKAEIKLNPAHLGPMEIKLSINDDKASIQFVAQHAPVRDALDQAMPRLREMLEQQGLNLADVDVSSQSERHNESQAGDSEASTVETRDLAESLESVKPEQLQRLTLEIDSAVNIYA